MAAGRVAHQSSGLLTPSEAIKRLKSPTDHKLFQAIRRQLHGDSQRQRGQNETLSEHHDWIREFLQLGGWDYLLDALNFLSHISGKNGESVD